MKQRAAQKSPLPPRGLSPHPSLPDPLPPGLIHVSHVLGLVVIQKRRETPLHPPLARGDREIRSAKSKTKVEYWRELLAYIDATYVKKHGRHYPWNNLARKNHWNLARIHCAWGVMALWELYLESHTPWAHRTGWSVYGMIRDSGLILDDKKYKEIAHKHEAALAKHRFGEFSEASLLLRRANLSAC